MSFQGDCMPFSPSSPHQLQEGGEEKTEPHAAQARSATQCAGERISISPEPIHFLLIITSHSKSARGTQVHKAGLFTCPPLGRVTPPLKATEVAESSRSHPECQAIPLQPAASLRKQGGYPSTPDNLDAGNREGACASPGFSQLGGQ